MCSPVCTQIASQSNLPVVTWMLRQVEEPVKVKVRLEALSRRTHDQEEQHVHHTAWHGGAEVGRVKCLLQF